MSSITKCASEPLNIVVFQNYLSLLKGLSMWRGLFTDTS